MKRVTKIEAANMVIPGIPNLYGLSKNRRACVRVKNKKNQKNRPKSSSRVSSKKVS